MSRFLFAPAFLLTLLATSGLAPAHAERLSQPDIVDVAKSAGSFETLLTALDAADLTEALQGDGPFTVFAPTDEAFAKVPTATLAALLRPENKEALQRVLTYHVVPERLSAFLVGNRRGAEALSTDELRFVKLGDATFINKARVVKGDVEAANGVIHVIDSVLIPAGLELKSAPRSHDTARPAPIAGLRFPSVQGDNLNNDTFRLPGDLEGDWNFVIIAFQRQQQSAVDTWMPAAAEWAETFPTLGYYEIPTLSKAWAPARNWIDGGMRRGIPDREVRGRTITLYIDKGPFRRALGIETERSIQSFLVNREGQVFWRASGRYDAEKARSFEATLTALTRPAPELVKTADRMPMEPGATALDPVEVIRAAIDKGVPMFNHGDAEGCTRVYMAALERLLHAQVLTAHEARTVRNGIAEAKRHHDAKAQAWALRHAMDAVYLGRN